MKKTIVAISMLFAYGLALASCPATMPYRCVVLMNGKQMCGCGM
jgi:hypothetical protein